MAKKSSSPIPSVGGVLRFFGVLPPRSESRRQPLVSAAFRLPLASLEAINLAATAYRVSRREVLNLVGGQLAALRNNSDALKLVTDLAGQISLENATRRTQALTKGSLQVLNDLAEKIGLPRDAIAASVLGLLGADLISLTQRQRKKISDGLKIVEDLRVKAEVAEAELIAVLGPEHPISWDSLTSGATQVHDELRKELHALTRSTGAESSMPVETSAAVARPKAKSKPKPKGSRKRKVKGKR
jgi:hypothetical protein